VGGVISELSNCAQCNTIEPCIETGTCPQPTYEGGCDPIPSLICPPSNNSSCNAC
jgi:hypothetical protein